MTTQQPERNIEIKQQKNALQRRVTARKYPFDQIYDNTTT